MKRYQAITLVLLLMFVFGFGNRTEADISDVTLKVHQALWHKSDEEVDLQKSKELSIKQVVVVQNETTHTMDLQEFDEYIRERFPNGYEMNSYSRTTTQIFDLWGTSTSEFSVGDIKGELKISAWRLFSNWKLSNVEITFSS